eukprot:GHVR01174307.1.p1 GENE.GHVR01174307.1~~GHVR01174307.1.p1  ORF type:complete len:342 (+),score=84.57 GHVR01174307.1:237-1262(+)
MSCASVLYRSTLQSVYVVVGVRTASMSDMYRRDITLSSLECWQRTFSKIESVIEFYCGEGLDILRGPTGLISLLLSVVATRGPSVVQSDFDDPSTTLIGLHGHCSQELVNLFLTGVATTNVFDDSKQLGTDPETGENFILKGVLAPGPIGHLSEMEARRYTEVGTYYKCPHYPIWVIGSPDHYSSIFANDIRVAHMSEAEKIEIAGLRAFRRIDMEHTGVLEARHLKTLLTEIGLQGKLQQVWKNLGHPGPDEHVVWGDLREQLTALFKDTGKQLRSMRLYHYDGQTPPGPELHVFDVELTDVDMSCAQGDTHTHTHTQTLSASIAPVLRTRWPRCIVTDA